ncbi:thiol-disulfide oxidoreductase DCC family protein [Thalassoglobus sp.]|uniref:thiol-disulfide oxidoreductase DCC family protein n=1 Tax=Thalassoglobus sp. TaxID=2795869 RepID=UPI003AA9C0CF
MSNSTEFEVFYDGDCPLCKREINLLKRWDKQQRIQFTNIAAEDFSAEEIGIPFEDLMAEIYGRLPDGSTVKGVEVFRQLYSAVGFSWLVGLSRIPGISHLLNFGYRVFARNRLRFTGRCNKESCEV